MPDLGSSHTGVAATRQTRVVAVPYLAIAGPGDATADEIRDARELARRFAAAGVIVVCGGLDGVMGAAAQGVADAGGTCVGLLPGDDRGAAHPALTVTIPTGMGEMRNALLVRSADVVLAVGGSWGTLSEVALALRSGVPVVWLHGWDTPDGPVAVDSVEAAADAVNGLLPDAR